MSICELFSWPNQSKCSSPWLCVSERTAAISDHWLYIVSCSMISEYGCYVLQAFDWVLHLPCPYDIHCNEGSEGCWFSLSATHSWCIEKGWFTQSSFRINDMPAFLTKYAWFAQTSGGVTVTLRLACQGTSI